MYLTGGEEGAIVQNGVTMLHQYERYCIRHPKPHKMVQTISEDTEGKIIYGKICNKCGQYLEEGRYKKEV